MGDNVPGKVRQPQYVSALSTRTAGLFASVRQMVMQASVSHNSLQVSRIVREKLGFVKPCFGQSATAANPLQMPISSTRLTSQHQYHLSADCRSPRDAG
jgi:hypothetical protein